MSRCLFLRRMHAFSTGQLTVAHSWRSLLSRWAARAQNWGLQMCCTLPYEQWQCVTMANVTFPGGQSVTTPVCQPCSPAHEHCLRCFAELARQLWLPRREEVSRMQDDQDREGGIPG